MKMSLSQAEEFKEGLKGAGFDFFTGVPCSIFAGLIEALAGEYIPAVREDTALGLAAGAFMGGKKPAVLMQNSGLGYSLNVLTSLNLIYNIGLLILVSFRGYGGRDAPEHIVMGRHCTELTELFKMPTEIYKRGNLTDSLSRAADSLKKGIPYCLFIKDGALV